MKKISMFLILLLLSANCFAFEWKEDKTRHALGGYILTDICQDNFNFNPLGSFLVVEIAGRIKEQSDLNAGSNFDMDDIWANRLGWLCKQFMTWRIEL